jgi:hypothetical protein
VELQELQILEEQVVVEMVQAVKGHLPMDLPIQVVAAEELLTEPTLLEAMVDLEL